MNVKQIDFHTIKQYWLQVDHFKDPNKSILEIITRLGPHVTPYSNPHRISYGLYDNDYLIGVTHLVQWSQSHVRYRTLNIREQYRGRDLGWFLLSNAWNDWKGKGKLFGWIRDSHYQWAKKHQFTTVDNKWFDNHIAMQREMKDYDNIL